MGSSISSAFRRDDQVAPEAAQPNAADPAAPRNDPGSLFFGTRLFVNDAPPNPDEEARTMDSVDELQKSPEAPGKIALRFVFDSTTSCAISVFYAAVEVYDKSNLSYKFVPVDAEGKPRDTETKRRIFLEPGIHQLFATEAGDELDVSAYPTEHLFQFASIKSPPQEPSESDSETEPDNNDGDVELVSLDHIDDEDEDEESSSSRRRSLRRKHRRHSSTDESTSKNKKKKKKITSGEDDEESGDEDEPELPAVFPIVIWMEPVLPSIVASDDHSLNAKVMEEFTITQATRRVQGLATYATLVKSSSSDSYELKVLRQKLMFDGTQYAIHDIYGMDSEEGVQTECVICMTESRDTVVLPCRHMCLCHQCAEIMKADTLKCPICRGPVRALMKVELSSEPDRKDLIEATEDDAIESGEEIELVRRPKTPKPEAGANNPDAATADANIV